MAFHLVQHPDLEYLASHFCLDLSDRRAHADPLDTDILIVQTPGMARWLTLKAADRNGIFTLARWMSPLQFVMKLGFLAGGEREKRSVFEGDVLPWALIRLLQEALEQDDPVLAVPLGHIRQGQTSADRQLRLVSLAEELGRMYEDYLLYRTDWLQAWEDGRSAPDLTDPEHLGHQLWQAELWRRIRLAAGTDNFSRASFFQRITDNLEQLKHGADRANRLPARLLLFGMSILPPLYLQLFAKLGEVIEVKFYLQLPSWFFFKDLESDRRSLRRKAAGGQTLPTDNRLLANLGGMSATFLDMVLETNPVEYEGGGVGSPSDQPLSLLARLQETVRFCQDTPTEPEDRADDRSLQLAACPGALREAEVVYDWLLSAFADLPDLTPDQILIVTPQPELYGPLLRQAAALAELTAGAKPLPLALADQSLTTEDRRSGLLLNLLQAASGRFELAVLLPLFEEARDLSDRPLGARDRENLARWCELAGIRWGKDGAGKSRLELPAEPAGTWDEGLDRLWAGWASGTDGELAPGFLGEPGPDGSSGALLLGELTEFLETLADLARLTETPRLLADWQAEFLPLLERLLPARPGQGDEVPSFRKALGKLSERAQLSGCHDLNLSWPTLLRLLENELDRTPGEGRFLSGAITVANILPMRSLPFRAVALIGLDRGSFPRQLNRPAHDLLQALPRQGDPDLLGGDRYLFLETLLAARDRLLVSWNQQDRGPSVLVELLTEELDRRFSIGGQPAGKSLVRTWPLHPFSKAYLQEPGLETWNGTWFNPVPPRPDPQELWQWRRPLPPQPDRLEYDRLLKALSDPLGWFYNQGLGAQWPREQTELPEREPLTLNNLELWKVKEASLQVDLGQDPLALKRLAARSQLPPGQAGDLQVALARRSLQSRVVKARSLADELSPGSDLKLNQLVLQTEVEGQAYFWEGYGALLDGAAPRQLLFVDSGNLKAKRYLRHWLSHLFFNLEGPTTTHYIALNATLHLEALAGPAPQRQAAEILRGLQTLVQRAETCFVPLFPEAAWAWLKKKDEEKKPDKKNDKEKYLSLNGIASEGAPDLAAGLSLGFESLEEWLASRPGLTQEFDSLAEQLWRPYLQLVRGLP